MIIAGIDEVGRGPLAGPVVAACVVLPDGYQNSKITDSKKIKSETRIKLAEEIKEIATFWKIAEVSARRIEQINIREATREAMEQSTLGLEADLLLIDGNMPIKSRIAQKTVIKGDSLHIQISAASIIAKVYRDQLMAKLDLLFPGYKFAKHAGYGTKVHLEAIRMLGPCEAHRKTFAGVKEYLQQEIIRPTG